MTPDGEACGGPGGGLFPGHDPSTPKLQLQWTVCKWPQEGRPQSRVVKKPQECFRGAGHLILFLFLHELLETQIQMLAHS